MSLVDNTDPLDHIEKDAAEAEALAEKDPNNSKTWWMSRAAALRHAADLIRADRKRNDNANRSS